MEEKKQATWDDLANAYDRENKSGRPARTLPMDAIWNWAVSRPDLFIQDGDGLRLIEINDK